MTIADDPGCEDVDSALASWRQGDCVLDGEHWFVYRSDGTVAPEEEGIEEDASLLETQVRGFVVLTQSCDVVRHSRDRPFITVAPLIEVDEAELVLVKRGYKPQFGFIPGVARLKLVADLDRAMTADKRVVARWSRIVGCISDSERRAFSRSITRKHARFAFPDDFMPVVRKLLDRLKEKHGKATSEGEALKDLREIRVRAAPSWDAADVELMFWFVCSDEESAARIRAVTRLESWLGLLPAIGRFKKPMGAIVQLEDLTGQDYVDSDRLDLDHLSGP